MACAKILIFGVFLSAFSSKQTQILTILNNENRVLSAGIKSKKVVKMSAV